MIVRITQFMIVICGCCILFTQTAPTKVETHNIQKRFLNGFTNTDFENILNHILQVQSQNNGQNNNNYGQIVTGSRWKRDIIQSNFSVQDYFRDYLRRVKSFKLRRRSNYSLFHQLMNKADEHFREHGEYPTLGGLSPDAKNGPAFLGGYGKK